MADEIDKELHFLNTLYGTRIYKAPCGCAILLSPHRPEGPFATWVQGCEEERRLYKDLKVGATTYVHRDGRVLHPEPRTLSHASALHHNHLWDALSTMGPGATDLMSSIYYPFGGLPADWHEQLNWRIGEHSEE